jgi:hypothetical protein
MSRSGELFMIAQEQLIEKYMDEHPDCTEEEAHNAVTGEDTMQQMADNWADMIDDARQRAKDERI